ncbi:MAG: PTS sugar transporter subunit IIA [Planctomycetaceae bacterium]
MSHEGYSIDELARQLGRDRREIDKLVNRGRIPGRKISGEWQFHPMQITHWLEQEMREYTDGELKQIENAQQSQELNQNEPVTSLLSLETVQVPLAARTKRSVLECLIEVAGRTWQIWEPSLVLGAIREREEMLSTGLEGGLAIPHPRNPLPDAIGQSLIAFGRTLSGIPFGAPRGELSDLFFLVLAQDSRTHLQIQARLARMAHLPEFLERLRQTQTPVEAYDCICEADECVARGG